MRPGQTAATRHVDLVIDDELTDAGREEELAAVLAHEINHAVQFAYDVFGDSWTYEATAEWMAEQLVPGSNELERFLPYWAATTETPLALRRDEPRWLKAYGSGVWNLWLANRYGPSIVRDTWEATAGQTPNAFHVGLLDGQLRRRGSSFGREFVRFSAAVAEWRSPGSGFASPELFPDVERVGTLQPGGAEVTSTLDHTTFALYDVAPSSASELKLDARLPDGVDGGVALVARPRGGGSPVIALRDLPEGGSATVRLDDPGRFDRVTAVLINSDITRLNTERDDWYDWRYARDDQPISARIVVPPDDAATAAPPAEPAPAPVPAPEPPAEAKGASSPTSADRRSPALNLTVASRLRLPTAASALRVAAVADEDVLLAADLRRGTKVIARVEPIEARAGRRVTLRLTLRRAERRLLAARGAFKVSVVAQAIDKSGNFTTRRVRVLLLRGP